jgi:suppressor of ftsI
LLPRLAAAATLALGVALVVSLDGAPRAQAPPPAILQPAPFTPGMPFTEPPVVSSRDGRLKTRLVARNGSVEISGVTVAETQTYAAAGPDGSSRRGFLGPTLRVRPGDRIELTLDSRLTVPDGAIGANCPVTSGGGMLEHSRRAQAGAAQLTNLHYHGLHVTPRERSPFGDSVLIELPNGKSRFRFRIPRDHDRGTFWYHAHLHGCTDDQVFRGLAGLLLVGDSRRDLPRRFRRVRTRSLALKDVQVEAADSGGWQIADDHDWVHATHRTVNGLVDPNLAIRPGETQLWRLANVSAGVWYDVALVDESNGAQDPLTVVAQDGNSLRRAVRRQSLVIPPGRRFDVLVRGPASGERVLKTLAFDQGRFTFPEDTLATVGVDGAPARAIAAPRRLTPGTQRFPRLRGPKRRFTFDIYFPQNQNDPPLFMINDAVFDADIPDAAPVLGTTERWTIYNKSGEYHPFHIHQDDFRVVDAGGGPPTLPGDQDVVPLPPGTPEKPSRVVIDMPFTDYSGNFVFHCHILDHEDGGMMSRVQLRRRGR